MQKQPPRSATETGDVIEKLTGIKRSPTQVRAFLKKKIKCLKTGSIPCKADPVAQKEFMEMTMESVRAYAALLGIELIFLPSYSRT